MKKLATKLTPAIKAWIKEVWNSNAYEHAETKLLFHFPNFDNHEGFKNNYHLSKLWLNYLEVSEQEFLAEFEKPKPIIQKFYYGEWFDLKDQENYRIKPTPDYSKEIEALQAKAKENNQKVTIIFE